MKHELKSGDFIQDSQMEKDFEKEETEGKEITSDLSQGLSYIPRSPRVKYSIMIRNLSIHCRERDLRELFGSFASPIYQLTIERNASDGRSLLHGFADCNDVEGGNRLIAEFDNRKFMGRRMRLERCEGSQRKIALQEAYASQFQIHFRYESMSQSESQSRVTEEMMERECGRYGEIVDVAIMRHTEYLDGEGRREIVFQKGYGFIYFLDGVGAAAARTSMISGGRVRCEMGLSHQMHMEDRLHVGGEREESMMSSSSLSLSSSLSTRTPTRTVTPVAVPAPSYYPTNSEFPVIVGNSQRFIASTPFLSPPSPLLQQWSFPVASPPLFLPLYPPVPPNITPSLMMGGAMMYPRWRPLFISSESQLPENVISTSMPPYPSMEGLSSTSYRSSNHDYMVRVSVEVSSSSNYHAPVGMDEDRRKGGGRGKGRGRRGRGGQSRRDRNESQSK
eukprot:gene2318-2464_t